MFCFVLFCFADPNATRDQQVTDTRTIGRAVHKLHRPRVRCCGRRCCRCRSRCTFRAVGRVVARDAICAILLEAPPVEKGIYITRLDTRRISGGSNNIPGSPPSSSSHRFLCCHSRCTFRAVGRSHGGPETRCARLSISCC